MKQNDIPLCLAVGFFALAIVFLFFDISNQVLISLSLSSFFIRLPSPLKTMLI